MARCDWTSIAGSRAHLFAGTILVRWHCTCLSHGETRTPSTRRQDAGHFAARPRGCKLTHLRLHNCGHIDDSSFQALGRCPQLQRVDISWQGISQSTQGRGATGSGLRALSCLQHLTHFKLSGGTTGGFVIASLGNVLGRRRFTGLPAGLILRNTPLRSLSLAGCSHVSDARDGLEAISTLAGSLTELCLASCRSLTGKGFGAIAQLVQLQALDLSECALRAALLAPLALWYSSV